MGDRPPIACKSAYCSGHAVKNRLCATCLKAAVPTAAVSAYKTRVANDPTKLLYDRAEWKGPRGTQKAIIRQNPLCQFLSNGVQCNRPSTDVHHLRDPKDFPELMHDPENLCAVCKQHHQGGQRGDTQGYLYVPTIWYGRKYPHIDSFGQPVLPKGKKAGERFDNWLKSQEKK